MFVGSNARLALILLLGLSALKLMLVGFTKMVHIRDWHHFRNFSSSFELTHDIKDILFKAAWNPISHSLCLQGTPWRLWGNWCSSSPWAAQHCSSSSSPTPLHMRRRSSAWPSLSAAAASTTAAYSSIHRTSLQNMQDQFLVGALSCIEQICIWKIWPWDFLSKWWIIRTWIYILTKHRRRLCYSMFVFR